MQIKFIRGYSAIELILALALLGLILYSSLIFSNAIFSVSPAQGAALRAYNYSQIVARYINTHATSLTQLLTTVDGQSNNKIITLGTQALEHEGFIHDSSYRLNNLHQYPCAIIYYDNKQLQSFVYYRSDGYDKQLSINSLYQGLNHMGAMLGLYVNGRVMGAARNWQLSKDFTASKLVERGDIDPSNGYNPEMFACSGYKVAKSSYVVNVTMMLNLNPLLPHDDTIHQNIDMVHNVGDKVSGNMMNNDLRLNYTKASSESQHSQFVQNEIVFQINPDCKINPQQPATLQDYDPNVDGRKNPNIANNLGCKNRQLAIRSSYNQVSGATLTVTGFQAAAIDRSKYLGALSTMTLQPTGRVAVGTRCFSSQLGTMAIGQSIAIDSSIYSLYSGQVQCMVNPLCAEFSDVKPNIETVACYMPINPVSIRYEGTLSGTDEFHCPIGTATVIPTVAFAPGVKRDIISFVPEPSILAGPNGCSWYHWYNTQHVSTTLKCSEELSAGLCKKFSIYTDFDSWGHGVNFEPCKPSGRSFGGNYNVVCTNDISRIPHYTTY